MSIPVGTIIASVLITLNLLADACFVVSLTKVARYRPDGYFKLHTDHVEDFNGLVCGGRLGTLILYLNDDFTGGQTDFPFVQVAVAPFAGDAIYFHSVQVRIPCTTRD